MSTSRSSLGLGKRTLACLTGEARRSWPAHPRSPVSTGTSAPDRLLPHHTDRCTHRPQNWRRPYWPPQDWPPQDWPPQDRRPLVGRHRLRRPASLPRRRERQLRSDGQARCSAPRLGPTQFCRASFACRARIVAISRLLPMPVAHRHTLAVQPYRKPSTSSQWKPARGDPAPALSGQTTEAIRAARRPSERHRERCSS